VRGTLSLTICSFSERGGLRRPWGKDLSIRKGWGRGEFLTSVKRGKLLPGGFHPGLQEGRVEVDPDYVGRAGTHPAKRGRRKKMEIKGEKRRDAGHVSKKKVVYSIILTNQKCKGKKPQGGGQGACVKKGEAKIRHEREKVQLIQRKRCLKGRELPKRRAIKGGGERHSTGGKNAHCYLLVWEGKLDLFGFKKEG